MIQHMVHVSLRCSIHLKKEKPKDQNHLKEAEIIFLKIAQ